MTLDCPCCGEAVFDRPENWFGDDEQETCSDCGCRVSIRVEESDFDDGTATAYTTVRPGDECGGPLF